MLFLLSSPLRSSSVSVVFDFNASLSDVVPVSPMLLSVVLMKNKKKKKESVDECYLCVFSFVLTT